VGRIRTIKPELPQSQSLGRCSREARFLFVLLMTLADDEGRLRAAPAMLMRALFPYDDDLTPAEVDGWMAELDGVGCVNRYTVGGNDYAEICKWSEHQKINRPSPGRYPAPDGAAAPTLTEDSVSDHGALTEDSVSPHCGISDPDPFLDPIPDPDPVPHGGERQPSPEDPEAPPPKPDPLEGFGEFWDAFAKKVDRPAAERAWRKLKPKPELVATIVARARAYVRTTPDKGFRRNPATWLNGRGWEDELIERGTGPPGRPRVPKITPPGYYSDTPTISDL
jgi:hypothetical protein